jgi:hypothetical protein
MVSSAGPLPPRDANGVAAAIASCRRARPARSAGSPDLIHVNDLSVVGRMIVFGRPLERPSGLKNRASKVRGVQIMFRKTLIALTAVLAVSLFAPSEASAWRGGGVGGFHGGGWHGGGWAGGWRGGGWRGGGWGPGLGLAAVGIGLGLAAAPFAYGGYGYPYGYAGGYPYGYNGYGDYGGCYLVRQQVMTAYGWRWRRVEVCD